MILYPANDDPSEPLIRHIHQQTSGLVTKNYRRFQIAEISIEEILKSDTRLVQTALYHILKTLSINGMIIIRRKLSSIERPL